MPSLTAALLRVDHLRVLQQRREQLVFRALRALPAVHRMLPSQRGLWISGSLQILASPQLQASPENRTVALSLVAHPVLAAALGAYRGAHTSISPIWRAAAQSIHAFHACVNTVRSTRRIADLWNATAWRRSIRGETDGGVVGVGSYGSSPEVSDVRGEAEQHSVS